MGFGVYLSRVSRLQITKKNEELWKKKRKK